MRSRQNGFTALVLGLTVAPMTVALVACETVRTAPSRGTDDVKTNTMLPVPSSRNGSGDGAVLVVANVEGVDDIQCRWRMVNQETGKSFFLAIKTEEPNVFATLDPGTYKTGRLGCGLAKVWDIDNVFPEGFKVEAGRASYLGKVIFQFKRGELEVVRKAPRSESAQAMQPAVDATGAGSMEVISGFTGQTFERGVSSAPEMKDGFDVHAKGIESPETQLAPLVTNLKSCAKSEGDAATMGHLEYVAVYREGRFSEMKSRDASGLTDRMRSCVERGMMTFHPSGPKTASQKNADLVEIRVKY